MAFINDFRVKNGLVVATTATILGATNSVSPTTGAVIVVGGAGIGGNLYVANKIYSQGSEVLTTASSITTSTNLAGGTPGSIPYQLFSGITRFIGIGSTGTVLTSNGSTATWQSPVSAPLDYIRKTSNYTASNGDKIIADTSAGTFTIFLPVTPSVGNNVIIVDGGNWTTSTLTVARNGSTIENINQDLIMDVGSIRTEFVYDGTTWQVYASVTGGIGGATIVNDTTTNVTQYISMTRTVVGDLETTYVSDSKLYFNPSTGVLNAVDFNALSDLSIKENVETIVEPFDILKNIDPVSFNWKDSQRKSYGVIAQEIEKVLPEIVSTNEDTGLKSVSYIQLIPFLVAVVKQQQEQINMIQSKLGNE